MAVRSHPALLERRVLRRAVLVTLVLAVPPIVVIRWVEAGHQVGRVSNLWLVAIGVILAAFLIGGAVAAAASRDLRLSHSAGAATYAYFVIAVGAVVFSLATGAPIHTASVLSLAMMGALSVSAAVLGGYGVQRWTGRPR